MIRLIKTMPNGIREAIAMLSAALAGIWTVALLMALLTLTGIDFGFFWVVFFLTSVGLGVMVSLFVGAKLFVVLEV